MSALRWKIYGIVAAWLVALPLAADDGDVNYLRDIKPLFRARCYACHGALKSESGLRTDTAKSLIAGGDSGPAIVPRRSGESYLSEKVTVPLDAGRMPPEGEPLSSAQIDALRRWIDAGAAVPDEDLPEPDPREHWAYQLPTRPPIPTVQNTAWVRNPIDAFVAAEYERLGLAPNAPAEDHALLRRAFLNLTGLPPTPGDVDEWARGESYESLVDRLLASPQYGQRWARHWMDVWRYSDWSGENKNLVRGSPKHIWRWRDWIVESLNDDKPYDRMVVEMLAGDEIAPGDPDVVRATGFLARNWYEFNRQVWLDDTVEHTARAFLGVTLGCAKCHDHKFDPISQREYYAWRAIFEPHDIRTDPVAGQTDLTLDGRPRVYDAHAATPTYLFIRGEETRPDKEHPLAPAVPHFFGGQFDVQPVALPLKDFYPQMDDGGENALRLAKAKVARAESAMQAVFEQASGASHRAGLGGAVHETDRAEAEQRLLAARAEAESVEARAAAERAKLAEQETYEELAAKAAVAERRAHVRKAQLAVLEAERKLQAAEQTRHSGKGNDAAVTRAEKDLQTARKALTTAQGEAQKTDARYSPLGPQYPSTSTGRRLALARWITERANPLAARVAVNHVWLRHFGEPLVASVDDFGRRTPRPRHAALLDWLACELMDSGWSLKHLQRLIVTSNVYRLASTTRHAPPTSLQLDPENHYLWRMHHRRAEGEVIRDSLLCVAGSLDLRAGGPEVSLDQAETARRRSIYFRHATERQVPFLEMFDGADAMECYRRSITVVPQQALALANSRLPHDLARELTQRLSEQATTDADFIRLAFERLLTRPPTQAEQDRCLEFLQDGSSSDSALLVRSDLVHALMNHHEFITIP